MSKMDKYLQDMLKKQIELDDIIEDKQKFKPEIFDYQVAIKVEIAELLNEIARFKWWKVSHKVKEDKVLEEAIDVIHFCLSAINKFNIQLRDFRYYDEPKLEIEFISNDSLMPNRTMSIVISSLMHLKFSEKAIYNKYLQKYSENIKRATEGY